MGAFRDLPSGSLTGTGQTSGVNVSQLEESWIWVTGTFVATIQVQVSPDGTIWVNEGSAVTAPGRVAIPRPAKFVRLNCTAFTSGQIDSAVTGVDDDRQG